ncbi:MAG: hypothetical protein JST00_11250 [Deltaproteobacteria bacterium]|nr:hypothetical protein [Deltaproteobacteria bacterium]
MNPAKLPLFLSALVSMTVGLVATGCSTRLDLAERTTGDSGVLRFEYTTLEGCLLGCDLGRPALVGSDLTVTTRGLDPSKRYVARLAAGTIGTIVRQSEKCSCATTNGSSTQSSSIAPEGTCAAGAQKSCFHQATIAVKTAGETKLELLTGDEIVDRVTVRSRDADRLELQATVDQEPLALRDGAYETRVGTSISLDARAFAGDVELVVGDGSLSVKSADPRILTAESLFLGAKAVAPGNASLTTKSASGAERTVQFRVVP